MGKIISINVWLKINWPQKGFHFITGGGSFGVSFEKSLIGVGQNLENLHKICYDRSDVGILLYNILI